MKNFIRNCLASTALSLVLLAFVASLYQANFICVSTIFQSLLANVIMHMGLLIINKIECDYYLMEIGLEFGYILSVFLISGLIFNWYSSTPLWVLITMTIVIYLTCCVLNIVRTNKDILFINEVIQSRKESLALLDNQSNKA